MKKSIIAILATTMMILSFLGPMFYVQPVKADDPADWYMTVPGVLDSDYYSLYPYEANSLTIGFSKYGEMIDGTTKIGLLYDGLDAFASDPYVPEINWAEGWLINITYAESGKYRNLWAFALYGDLESYGGDWNNFTLYPGAGYGGRQVGGTIINGSSTGWAWTGPIQVLYHGPRRFVAVLETTIGTYEGGSYFPVVKITITVIFDKVKKYVILLKDIKLVDIRKTIGDLQVEFSERGEWDMGQAFRPPTHAYWYENQSTCYHTMPWHPFYNDTGNSHPAWYDVAQLISQVPSTNWVGYAAYWPQPVSKWIDGTNTFTRMLESLETHMAIFTGNGTRILFRLAPDETPANPYPIAYPWGSGVWREDPMVWVNNAIREEGFHYEYNATDHGIYFYPAFTPALGDNITAVYKTSQVKKDFPGTLPCFVVGEWDFRLTYNNITESTHQFRAVTVYGMVNNHDADDDDFGYGHQNILDREVVYQLDEVFMPFDLNDAVHKDTARWVEFVEADGISTIYNFTHNYYDTGEDVVGCTNWDEYCSDSEKILVDGVLQVRGSPTYDDQNHKIAPGEEGHPTPRSIRTDATYDLVFNTSHATGVQFDVPPEEGAVIKILYSTCGAYHWDHWGADPTEDKLYCDYNQGRYEWIVVGRDSAAVDSAGAAMISEYFDSWKNISVWCSGLDMKDDQFGPEIPSVFTDFERFTNPGGLVPRESFRDADVDYNEGRAALKDDWCTHVPVASSDIIVIGGPSANLAAEYFNDFTDAFATLGQWTPNPANAGKIIPLSCWSMNRRDSLDIPGYNITHAYVPEYGTGINNQTIGYAVVSAYKDLNGTVAFIVWGYTGQDTYYACWTIWNTWLGYKLQNEPDCLTTLVLRFNYTTFVKKDALGFPTHGECFWDVVEALGTISEYHFKLANYGYPYYCGTMPWCEFASKQPPLHPDP